MNNNTFHNDSLKREDNSMRVLVDTLNFHTKLYDEGRPIISDEDWDKMYFSGNGKRNWNLFKR